jgi:hypothetical protein
LVLESATCRRGLQTARSLTAAREKVDGLWH